MLTCPQHRTTSPFSRSHTQADHTRALLQFRTKLYIVDLEPLSKELFYQQVCACSLRIPLRLRCCTPSVCAPPVCRAPAPQTHLASLQTAACHGLAACARILHIAPCMNDNPRPRLFDAAHLRKQSPSAPAMCDRPVPSAHCPRPGNRPVPPADPECRCWSQHTYLGLLDSACSFVQGPCPTTNHQ